MVQAFNSCCSRNPRADSIELLSQQSCIDILKLQRPNEQPPQSLTSVLTRSSSIAVMLDGIDSLEPVGQYRRVNCLFETSTNFKRPTPWSKHSIPGVKSMKSYDSIRCSSNNNTLVQVFNSWSANVSIL
jgi:hypothetical protein